MFWNGQQSCSCNFLFPAAEPHHIKKGLDSMPDRLGQLAPALISLRIASVLVKSVDTKLLSPGVMSVHCPVNDLPSGGKIYVPPFLLICVGQGGSSLCFCRSKLIVNSSLTFSSDI